MTLSYLGLLKHLHLHASSFVPQALLNSRNSSHLLTPVQYDGNPVIPIKSSRSMRLILSTSSCGQPNTLSPFVARRRTSPTSCMSHNARIINANLLNPTRRSRIAYFHRRADEIAIPRRYPFPIWAVPVCVTKTFFVAMLYGKGRVTYAREV
jgi:hypothetical protein